MHEKEKERSCMHTLTYLHTFELTGRRYFSFGAFFSKNKIIESSLRLQHSPKLCLQNKTQKNKFFTLYFYN
ncbi:MAG: hypothetical protein ACI8RD_005963 [Bacillariaceae sp.]|jgi:hypothetical protein